MQKGTFFFFLQGSARAAHSISAFSTACICAVPSGIQQPAVAQGTQAFSSRVFTLYAGNLRRASFLMILCISYKYLLCVHTRVRHTYTLVQTRTHLEARRQLVVIGFSPFTRGL